MDVESFKTLVDKIAPGSTCEMGKQYLEATIAAEYLHSLCVELKANKNFRMDYLFCLTGIDTQGKLGVIYHIQSTELRHCFVIRVLLNDRTSPEIDTVSDVWRAAEFAEREVFDLYGVNFRNHPDMRRLFLDDSFVGYPLRKDYVDEINLIER